MRYLRWCLGLARGQGHTIALGLVCMLGATICDIAVPQVTGAALNAALAGNRPAFMARIRTIVALLAVSGGLDGRAMAAGSKATPGDGATSGPLLCFVCLDGLQRRQTTPTSSTLLPLGGN